MSGAAVLALLVGGTAFVAQNQSGPPGGSAASPDGTSPVDPGPALTTISLTFDSGRASQVVAAQALRNHGLRGTFFINSGFVGAPGYMTRDDLNRLAAAQNEIGGHTVTLADVTAVEHDEAIRQICNDRVSLTDWGFKVTSFSYPFGSVSPETEELVAGCGYNSARSLGETRSRFGCDTCTAAEAVPPAKMFHTRSAAEIGNAWTLADLQEAVLGAEKSGGWLQLVFYDIDDSGSDRSIKPALFEEFTAWLAGHRQPGTTAVRTVHDVIGGLTKPAVAGPAVAAAQPGVNPLRNPGLETAGKYGLPECWQVASYGKNTPTLSTISPGRTGSIARRLDVEGYESGDAKLLPVLDLGACAPSVSAGHSYELRAWYFSTAHTQFEVYYRTKVGIWTYWTASPWFPANQEYQQATWTTPPVPDEAVAISFGLNLFSDGQLLTDDYEMYDAAGAPGSP